MPTAKKDKGTSTYTFSVCHTCRRRRVKCPEEKPECSRCVKLGLTCGYDFRFAEPGSNRTFRRPLGAVEGATWIQPALPSTEVNAMLKDVDLAHRSLRKGPFSVLSLGIEEPDRTASQPRRRPTLGREDVEKDPHDSSASSSRVLKASTPGIPSSEMTLQCRNTPSPPTVRDLNLLTLPPKQARLFEYFSTTLSSTISPNFGSTANPFRYVYPSLALEGLRASAEDASSRLAIFHGICGTAAWSLRHVDSSYAELSVHHDGLALRFIQQTIDQRQAFCDAVLPAAIMACLSGENVAGRIDSWGKHVKAGLHCLLGAVSQQKNPDSITSLICECYLLGAACGNFGTHQELNVLRSGIVGNNYSYIEECHGLPRPVLDSMVSINLLTATPQPYDPAKVEQIRKQIVSAAPKLKDSARHYIANAFYYATQICYTKWICQSTSTQPLAVKALEQIDLATTFAPGRIGRINKWVLYTIGAELTTNTLRNRMFRWCQAQLGALEFKGMIELLHSTWSTSDRPDVDDPVHACWRFFGDQDQEV